MGTKLEPLSTGRGRFPHHTGYPKKSDSVQTLPKNFLSMHHSMSLKIVGLAFLLGRAAILILPILSGILCTTEKFLW
jgi:hypothetical protein